jgi:hypothetical protein
MAPNKAPGVDGFNAGFFQTHWQLIKPCVVSAFLGFLNGDEIPVDVNKTLQVLIPKVNNPQDLYECIHYLRNKKGKTGGCDIKLDMAKAYDRVEWEYLNAIMQALGFPAS